MAGPTRGGLPPRRTGASAAWAAQGKNVPTAGAIVGVILTAIVIAVVLAALVSWFVMLLWNGVVSNLTGFHHASFWQAFGLVILVRLLTATASFSRSSSTS